MEYLLSNHEVIFMPMLMVTGCRGAVGSTNRTCCSDCCRASALATSIQPFAVSPSPWIKNTVALGKPPPAGGTISVFSAEAMVEVGGGPGWCNTHTSIQRPGPALGSSTMVISKRAGAKKAGRAAGAPMAPPSNRGIVKADWREGFKKPQAGVSDMTLLTQITNEAVNDNLQKRFANGEIYVRTAVC